MGRKTLKSGNKTNHPLWHQFLKICRQQGVKGQSILVGVSGGLDSVVLLDLLHRSCQTLNLSIHVMHVHHGPADTKKQSAYRKRAAQFCEGLSQRYQLPFYQKQSRRRLRSESEFREFRYRAFAAHLRRFKLFKTGGILATAHHSDDLLETRLIRLIRGTGAQGLAAMREREAFFFRPLLSFGRSQLEDYARAHHLKWLNDPSNEDLDPLRNWLRRKWLVDLERRNPGSRQCLARSLELISRSLVTLSTHRDQSPFLEGRIRRQDLLDLSKEDQQLWLAAYMRHLGVLTYTHRHIEEILKRLDSPRKNLTFVLAKCEWQVGPEWIQAARLSPDSPVLGLRRSLAP